MPGFRDDFMSILIKRGFVDKVYKGGARIRVSSVIVQLSRLLKMKAVVILTVLALAVIAYSDVAVDVECPEDEDPDFVTLIKNPYNCSTYFVCQGGDPILMECPKGLQFNDKLKTCDWPNSAKCKPIKLPV